MDQFVGNFSNATEIQLVPAVRDPKGACIDEHNCDYERYTVCAFNNQSFAAQFKFLECMDAPWSDPLTMKKPEKCAKTIDSMDWSRIQACYNGELGLQLLQAAAKVFVAQFPKSAYMPQVAVNGKVIDASYSSMKDAVCAAGAQAAACN